MAFELNNPITTGEAQWRKRAEAVLKGADFDAVLTSKTSDGLRIAPLYSKAEGHQPITGRAPAAAWSIMSRIDNPDAVQANAQALTDLENGATGLALVFENAVGAYGFGLPAKAADVADALKGVYLDAGIDLTLDCGPRGRDAAHAFAQACKALGFPPATVRVRFGLNPAGLGARDGVFPAQADKMAANVAASVNDLVSQGFAGPFIVADGRIVHNAGGSEAHELGFVLANAVFYLRALEAYGIALDDGRRMIEFRLSSDADQFLSIAKHRALRRLWASIERQCLLEPKPILLGSETAYRMMARRDPHVNLLRTGMGCFAAAIGGADSVTVLPFTTALGLADPFARRLARNTQLVLLEEAHLAAVSDPAAGAGGYEALTDALVAEGWSQFRQIENEGGIVASLNAGFLQSRISVAKTEREKAIADQQSILVGVTAFLDQAAKPVEVLAPVPPEVTHHATSFPPLTPQRWSEPFERGDVSQGTAL
jgi:methylmalonyl-CoA mutase